jgi:hypothetical protein
MSLITVSGGVQPEMLLRPAGLGSHFAKADTDDDEIVRRLDQGEPGCVTGSNAGETPRVPAYFFRTTSEPLTGTPHTLPL